MKEENRSEKSTLKQQSKRLELQMKEAKLKELELKLKRSELKHNEELLNQADQFGTVSEPRKSLSTYLRNQNKVQISLVSILDRKSAILIRITTTIVSGLVVFRNYIESNVDNGELVAILLMIGMMLSLILSIMATKPFGRMLDKVFQKQILPEHPKLEENNFVMMQDCTLKEYEESMQKVIKSQSLQLGNQIRANYVINMHNNYKSKIVDLAYSVFLITFVVVALVFLISRLF